MSRNDTGDRIIRHDEEGPRPEGSHDEGRRQASGSQPPPAEFSGETASRPGGSSSMGRGGDSIVHSSGAPGEVGRPSDPGNRTVGGPDEKPRETRRRALDMAPGIPAGGNDLETALDSGDRDLGGATAADTTPGGATEDRPDREQVRREDKGRTTL